MAVLDQVPARRLDVGRALLTALAAVLYLLGWLPSKVGVVVSAAVAWCVAAVKVGWADARTGGG